MAPRRAVLLAAALAAITVVMVQWRLGDPAEAQRGEEFLPRSAAPQSAAPPAQSGSRQQSLAAERNSAELQSGPVAVQELDSFAARFAAEPALIDALEDAGSPDPQVRADAEKLLSTLSLAEPDPAQPRP